MSKSIYLILEQLLDEKGISVAEAARICNLPDSTVRGIITRKQKNVALEVAFKLSGGLGVSLEYLNGVEENNSTLSETLRTNLLKYSKARNVSQKDIAKALSVSPAAVSHWFKGDNAPSLDLLPKIGEILSVPVSDLFVSSEEAEKESKSNNTLLEKSSKLLVALGYIKPGEDLSAKDLSFLNGIISLLDTWFSAERRGD